MEEFVQEDVKEIGRIERPNSSDIVIRETVYKGIRYIDIRHWLKTQKYTGWSKKGLAIPISDFPRLMEILKKVIL